MKVLLLSELIQQAVECMRECGDMCVWMETIEPNEYNEVHSQPACGRLTVEHSGRRLRHHFGKVDGDKVALLQGSLGWMRREETAQAEGIDERDILVQHRTP